MLEIIFQNLTYAEITKKLVGGKNALCITEQTLFHEEKAAQRARKGLRDHAGVQGCTVCVTPNEILVCEETAKR